MKSLNKYKFDSCLLHEECKSLYKKPHKLLITNEVLYKLFKDENNKTIYKNNVNNQNTVNNVNNENNENNENNKVMYKKILNFFGCY